MTRGMSLASTLNRWMPTPLVKGSAALHAGAVAMTVSRPALWPIALGAVAANHLLLAGCGLWPRSALLGPNWTHLPVTTAADAIALTIDDGPDPAVTPQVLALLARAGAKATFFCVGERIRRHPELARAIVGDGHAIENHSQRHLNHFSVLGPKAIAREIREAQDSIEAVIGLRPRFFRAPAGLRSPLLEPVLIELELRLASWTRRGFDTVNRAPDSVLAKLTRGLKGRDILLLHDGSAARTVRGAPVILEVLPRLLDALAQARLRPITLRAALI
jgi:peptidoglycan/xylan/chitin deacetylase (PgdA/CDA1 family)